MARDNQPPVVRNERIAVEVARVAEGRFSLSHSGEISLGGVPRTRDGGWVTVTTREPSVPVEIRTVDVHLVAFRSADDRAAGAAVITIGIDRVRVGEVEWSSVEAFHTAMRGVWSLLLRSETSRALNLATASGVRMRTPPR